MFNVQSRPLGVRDLLGILTLNYGLIEEAIGALRAIGPLTCQGCIFSGRGRADTSMTSQWTGFDRLNSLDFSTKSTISQQ